MTEKKGFLQLILTLTGLSCLPCYYATAGEFLYRDTITITDIDYEIKQPADLKNNNTAPPVPVKPPDFYQKYDKDSYNQDVVYFIELRKNVGAKNKWILKNTESGSRVAMYLQPGDILKFKDSPGDYIHKLRLDKNNQGLWKKVNIKNNKSEELQVYYDWRDFETMTTYSHPIEVEVIVPPNRQSIPVFDNPADWHLTYCQHKNKPCVRDLTKSNPAQLLDSVVVKDTKNKNEKKYKLFYKIAFQIEDHLGDHWSDEGWIPSEYIQRNISYLPNHIIASRGPSNVYRHVEEKKKFEQLKRQFVFQTNIDRNQKSPNRWLSSESGDQEVGSLFDSISIDGVVAYNHFEMEQSFLTDKFTQDGLDVGATMYAPIFADLELQGSAVLTVPFKSNGGDGADKTFLIRADQYLMYTSPYSALGMDIKFAIGAYFQSMLSSQSEFGFSAFVGFQAKLLLENKRFMISSQFGPIGQDLGFNLENSEVSAEIGIRFNPELGYKSWMLFTNYSDTSYRNSKTETSTDFQFFRFGLKKQF